MSETALKKENYKKRERGEIQLSNISFKVSICLASPEIRKIPSDSMPAGMDLMWEMHWVTMEGIPFGFSSRFRMVVMSTPIVLFGFELFFSFFNKYIYCFLFFFFGCFFFYFFSKNFFRCFFPFVFFFFLIILFFFLKKIELFL